ncbi:MAG: hypothetical protein H0T84_15265, partial [Tatlockia sp.]|nr:hypothetical protein [Tatlockia sp.]
MKDIRHELRLSGKSKPKWEREDRLKKTAYIYYPGKGDTQATAATLIGKEPLATTTGETVSLESPGICTLPRERIWNYPELPENDLDQNEFDPRSLGYSISKLWRRNLKVSKKEAGYQPLGPHEERKGSLANYRVDYAKSSMGQKTDVLAHQYKYEALQKYNEEHGSEIDNIVLYGVSRGAATTFRKLGTLGEDSKPYEDIKLCVLEGPPASMSDVIKNYVGKSLTKKLYNPEMQTLVSFVCGDEHSTDKDAQAQAYVDTFPIHVPLLIVSSKKDGLVPHSSSAKLALRVAARRQIANDSAAVYLLQLDTCGHNDYTTNNSRDSQRYQNFVHAVYRKEGLAYIEEYANKGEV